MLSRLKKASDNLDVGVRVWLQIPMTRQQSGKPKYAGPYRIVDKPTELYRTLSGLPEGIHPVIHIDRLKPYLDSELRVKAAEEEQKYEIPQEPVMKQERITSAKMIDGGLKFRVKWEGLSIKNSTWMTKEEVDAKVMEVYERKEAYKKAKQATTRKRKPPNAKAKPKMPKRARVRPITPKFPAKRSTNHAYEYITAPGNFKRLRGRNELSRREIVKRF
ncbi:hypothetical protein Pelo_1460 [Pelomyxa schiedti]|nr:hypothetical protein Pelo_1460 [Pelomyxa schiedti]